MYSENLQLLINGQWTASGDGKVNPVYNPATGEIIASVPCASTHDLDRALEGAQAGFNVWKRLPAIQRYDTLNNAADLIEARKLDIARTMTQENGKPLGEATGEVQFCADAVRWYAEEARRAYGRVIPARMPGTRQLTLKEPVGPALGFAAWNFPAGNVALKIGAALAAGCSIIVKPSDETPGSAVAIGRCFQDAGVPAGVVNIVFGDPAPISEYLIRSPIPKKVSLTGSTPVGKLLARLAAETLKRCTMELGGHAPVLVFDDADLDYTINTLVAAKFRNAGQVCTSPTRFYVHRKIYDRFIAQFTEQTQQLVIGNGLDDGVQVGPMITERRLAAVDELVRDAAAKGATVVTGGQRLDRPGYFYAPTVIRDVPDNAHIMIQEPFGPLAPITPFDTFDEVIARANSLPYGLAAYVFTRDSSIAARASESLDAGQVGVNGTSVHEVETPFGGVNESGYGHESGIEGLDAYLRTKLIADKQLPPVRNG
ncbi:NAD-dependent succinate-semialdehyde dehydrogenase [Burkholderia pyrrocinia]|uniref:NAD-dependent succinate-semialdehyde dehydrogenase n=1 Tax=Burkholderia pyrrocinia TaxID=60550 RepID=UPI001575C83A|nr:NAD-dependent succinate-semialdehyde dehydrogenase [Burkholderia pyrrocinia]NTX26746.1 NAD-dependent succinate-semialdehyde dehydrogenase [Burkholderia pyrrocinia]